MAKNTGKELEGKVQEALQRHKSARKSFYHRFPDTTAARGQIMQAQPGDWLWLLPGVAILLEAKSTEVGAPLLDLIKSSKTSRSQVPKHSLWHISGHQSAYIWADTVSRVSKAYDGKSVVAAINSSDKGLLRVIHTGVMDKLEDQTTALENYFRV